MPVAEGVLTVRDVWRLALPEGTRLLGGGEGLGAPVEWAASLRTSYPLFGALREGYIALARLALLRVADPTITPETLLGALRRAGAAALVVDEPLAGDGALADRFALPLLCLPAGEDLHAVERDILRALVDREGAEARREVEAHQRLRDAFERSGVQGVVDDLARATGGRAVLRDGSGLVVASAGAAAPGGAVETYPVRAAGRLLGELTLEPGDEGTPRAGLLARQAAEVAAMGLIDSLARLETEERLGADLVEQVLEGALSEESLAARLRRLGYRPPSPARHVVVAAEPGLGREGPGRAQVFAADLRWAAEREGASAAIASHAGRTYVFLAVPGEIPDRRWRGWLRSAAERVEGADLALGVSRPAGALAGLSRAIQQAREAAALGRRVEGRPGPHYYDELGLYRLLAGLGDQEELRRFYQETLGDLVRYDAENHTELLRTLSVYFQEHANASRTARALYVHRNTLSYRLQRIAEITGTSLDDPQARLALQLALLIHRLLPAR
jgi:purine catabolism regulator